MFEPNARLEIGAVQSSFRNRTLQSKGPTVIAQFIAVNSNEIVIFGIKMHTIATLLLMATLIGSMAILERLYLHFE